VQPRNNERGISLLEVVFAAGLVAGAFAALAQLFAFAAADTMSARSRSAATVLAAQKMEQLRGLAWVLDTSGTPVSDTTTDTAAPVESPAGGTGLSPSPAGTLRGNTAGYVDYLDRWGNSLGGGGTTPPGALYTRRWSITPLPDRPDTLALQVVVTGPHGSSARLDTLRTRSVP